MQVLKLIVLEDIFWVFEKQFEGVWRFKMATFYKVYKVVQGAYGGREDESLLRSDLIN